MSLATELEAIMGKNAAQQEVKYWLDTGFAPLNKAISGRYKSGLPVGRIVEMFGGSSCGKTAIATKAMAAAQQMGGIAAFMDHENSFDVGQAETVGLDPNGAWVYKTPETFEESVDDAVKLARAVRSKQLIAPEAPIIVAFDSLASMVPQSKLYDSKGNEKGAGDLSMHDNLALAKCTSSAFPALAQMASKFNMLLLFLNQTRTKPGLCLRYDAQVTLADGTTEKIGKLVHAREPVDILTVDPATGEVKVAKIAQFHRNKHDGGWIHLVTAGGRGGKRGLFLTPEHQVLTPDGWVRADELEIGGRVVTVDKRHYTDDQHRLILASLLGDGQIRFGDGKHPTSERARLRMVHGHKQTDYLRWKARLLGIDDPKITHLHSYADSASSLEFLPYREIKKFKALLEVPETWVEKIDAFVAAIWFMDDGTYSAKSGGLKYGDGKYEIAAKKLTQANLDLIASHFQKIGLGLPKAVAGRGLKWIGEQAALFGASIARYVPSSMSYKLNRNLTAGGDSLKLESFAVHKQTYSNLILSVERVKSSDKKDKYKYDIGVEDTHTFVAGGGIVVHNSYGDPTTTPGGNAPEFYASCRIQLTRSMLKDKDRDINGQEVRAFLKKNKVSAPFREATWRFMFNEDGSGKFDTIYSTLEHMKEIGLIPTAGAYLEFEGKKYHMQTLADKIESEGRFQELLDLLYALDV
jgi:recombination protein RecA